MWFLTQNFAVYQLKRLLQAAQTTGRTIFFLQLILFTYMFSATKQKLADNFNGELRVWEDIDEWKILDLPF